MQYGGSTVKTLVFFQLTTIRVTVCGEVSHLHPTGVTGARKLSVGLGGRC